MKDPFTLPVLSVFLLAGLGLNACAESASAPTGEYPPEPTPFIQPSEPEQSQRQRPTPEPVRVCTTQYAWIFATVVDAEDGTEITGAYWRSTTESGRVVVEVDEGWTKDSLREHPRARKPEPYMIVDSSFSGPYFNYETVTVDFLVSKYGYQSMERQFDVLLGWCHPRNIVGDTVFKMVRDGSNEPPGDGRSEEVVSLTETSSATTTRR